MARSSVELKAFKVVSPAGFQYVQAITSELWGSQLDS